MQRRPAFRFHLRLLSGAPLFNQHSTAAFPLSGISAVSRFPTQTGATYIQSGLSGIPLLKMTTHSGKPLSFALCNHLRTTSAVSRFEQSAVAVSRFTMSAVARFTMSAVARFTMSAVARFTMSAVARFTMSAVARFLTQRRAALYFFIVPVHARAQFEKGCSFLWAGLGDLVWNFWDWICNFSVPGSSYVHAG